jgi:hypothetical protein
MPQQSQFLRVNYAADYAAAEDAAIHNAGLLRLLTRQHVIVRPSQGVTAPGRFAVPGWTDEQTQYWLDNATSCAGCG